MSPFSRAGCGAVVGLRDTEVGEHEPSVRTEKQVRRLHVTVDDAGVVHGRQGGEQLQAERGHHRRREPAPATEEIVEGAVPW